MSLEDQMKVQRFKELTPEQQEYIAKSRDLGDQISTLLNDILENAHRESNKFDMRFLAMAKTDLQTGLMKLNRGIINPDFF